MKRTFISILILISLLFNINTIAFAEEIKMPDVDAQGAILMDFETGRVLWEKNAYEPMAMASTTKIMTAILAIESGKLNDTVVVSQKASTTPPVKMFLKKGEEIKLEFLLYALMMQSSNDAAVAIAEHVSGSVEQFCKDMTDKAYEIGAKDTVFETPNGLDSGNHHSTAYDLAVITRYSLNNKKFMEIINTKTISFSSNKSTYSIYNKNRLLSEFVGANGVKTGYTGKAGQCFVGAAKRGDMQLISVVLASGWGNKGKEQKWVDSKRILSFGFDNYKYKSLVNKDDKAGEFNVTRSKTDSMETFFDKSVKLPLTKAEFEKVYIKTELPIELKAPISSGDKVGVAKVYIDNELVDEIDLLVKDDVYRFDVKTCLEEVLDSFFKMGTRENINIELPEIPMITVE